jgi:pyruvate/2-oxoglutarate dehydrogenase complex dihydrolipoamide acyltransferase (E2) component
VTLPGQIAINTDRVAHIMPNAAGVVREVLKNVGDTVEAGEVIAWLESAELGAAKVDYLSKWAELTCCSKTPALGSLPLLQAGVFFIAHRPRRSPEAASESRTGRPRNLHTRKQDDVRNITGNGYRSHRVDEERQTHNGTCRSEK